MIDELKCALFSLGVGMVVGAVLTANNKKIQSAVKDAGALAEEKIEKAKDGIEKIKKEMSKSKPKVEKKNSTKVQK